MRQNQDVGGSDLQQILVGGGCILGIPLTLAAAMKVILSQAQKKQQQSAHQVEEITLDKDSPANLDAGLSAQDALGRFVKKLERITDQFQKLGGRFSAADFSYEKAKLDSLRQRIQAEAPTDAECQQLLSKAEQCLQQYAPQS